MSAPPSDAKRAPTTPSGLPRPPGVKSKSNRNTPVVTRNRNTSKKPSLDALLPAAEAFSPPTGSPKSWPTPAEAAAAALTAKPSNDPPAASLTPPRKDKRSSYMDEPVTPSAASLCEQAPASIVSADRKLKQSQFQQSCLEEAQAFLDEVILGTSGVSSDSSAEAVAIVGSQTTLSSQTTTTGLSAEEFMDAVCSSGLPLCRLMNRIMGTMRIKPGKACPSRGQQTQNAIFFMEASAELLKGSSSSHSKINVTDVLHRRLKPVNEFPKPPTQPILNLKASIAASIFIFLMLKVSTLFARCLFSWHIFSTLFSLPFTHSPHLPFNNRSWITCWRFVMCSTLATRSWTRQRKKLPQRAPWKRTLTKTEASR